MTRSRWRYIFTWIALALLLAGSVMLLVLSWNRLFPGPPSPALMILSWVVIAASGIFLFMLAVKKAHRQWIDESRAQEAQRVAMLERRAERKEKTDDPRKLDFAVVAAKLVRRIPEGTSMEDTVKLLLRHLAREVEIMSGICYVKRKDAFHPVSTYALPSPEEPAPFAEGEGLTGQAAKDRHVMVMTRLPEAYLEVCSGLGRAKPAYLAIVPLVRKNRTVAVLEFSGYRHEPHDIENMCRILARDLMQKLTPEHP